MGLFIERSALTSCSFRVQNSDHNKKFVAGSLLASTIPTMAACWLVCLSPLANVPVGVTPTPTSCTHRARGSALFPSVRRIARAYAVRDGNPL
jgi:hypothetical protein